jgi:endonuclease/exonuclease/phosphatase family metal-dependent hydrolase
MILEAVGLMSALAATPVLDPQVAVAEPPPAIQTASAEISVLTYNIRGLPWPIALGRRSALREIGQELAAMRADGRQPDIVLIQEGFRGEVANLVKTSGYRYWAQGPSRSDRAHDARPADAQGYKRVRYRRSGEGWGKFTGAGLHVLSDAPITNVAETPYRYCAGLDCLANKGVMLARIALPDVPGQIDVVNTHLNSKRASRTPRARSSEAHNLQTEELLSFISDHRSAGAPLLVGGDFNVKGAPERYDFDASTRPYKVVSEFCGTPANACEGLTPSADTRPWLRSQDLQAFEPAATVDVRPVRVETVFGADASGKRLSDHDGYLVRYRLTWSPAAPAPAQASGDLTVRPLFKAWGLKAALAY